MFPYLPGQSGYNKRLRKSTVQMRVLIRLLAAETNAVFDDVWLVDSTPVECGPIPCAPSPACRGTPPTTHAPAARTA